MDEVVSVYFCSECHDILDAYYKCKYCEGIYCPRHEFNHTNISKCDSCCNLICKEMSCLKNDRDFSHLSEEYNVLCSYCYINLSIKALQNKVKMRKPSSTDNVLN